MQWTLKKSNDILKTVPFTVQALELIDNRTEQSVNHLFHRLKSPDWVNVMALTDDKQAVLVKQQRAGTLEYTLETPGGVVDPGEDPKVTALRELEEETGYSCQKLIKITQINPNPAIMTNTLHMFLACGCAPKENRELFPDTNEDIEVVLKPSGQLDNLVRSQEINSALAALTIYTSMPLWPK